MSIREVSRISKSEPTLEGAGVHLKRAFGYYEVPLLDPFLLLDDFHSDNPDDYIAGFPWHPHRGIETVTYMLHGDVKHGDSIGNAGIIGPGDVQWMTAGSGIIHEEMPQSSELLWGFQLWVNLPASHKMMKPRYQEVKQAEIPEVTIGDAKVRVICGEINGTKAPVQDIVVAPEYLDVTISDHGEYEHTVKKGHTVFAYMIEGGAYFGSSERLIGKEHLVILGDGDKVVAEADSEGARLLLVSGKPLGEPVEWRGPIVMNTQQELLEAFEEYRNGTFIK